MMSERSPVTSGPHVDTAASLPVLVKAVWLVMKKRDVKNFGRILEFLELTHEQVPGLLCYMHHAKLSTGLRGKIVLHMIEERKPLLDILTALNCYFPPVFPDDSAAGQRKVFKVRQCKIHFRKLVLRMIRDEKFRKNYVENMLHLEYGDTFMSVLEKLLWEFLFRLQIVLHHQVPQTTKLPVVNEDHISSTPIHPRSELILLTPGISEKSKTKEMSKAKKKKAKCTAHNVTSTDRPEENPNTDDAQYEEWQNPTQNKHGHGRCGGTASQAEGLVQEPVHRRTRHLVNRTPTETHPPYFAIFGFDCSESSKVNHYKSLSPPDPLQSQGLDLDLEHTRHDVMGQGFSDIHVTEVAQTTSHSPVSNHEQRSIHDGPGGNCEGQGKPLAHGLMSLRYQPRVHLMKLPLNIINKYLGQEFAQDETPKEDLTHQSQQETFPDSDNWFWVCSDPTDNDSSDPDYFPGASFFCHVGGEISRIQPKRGLHFHRHHESS